ncbi:hypothetical protein EV177_010150, partial [Coemansia sp. RSA 1804]
SGFCAKRRSATLFCATRWLPMLRSWRPRRRCRLPPPIRLRAHRRSGRAVRRRRPTMGLSPITTISMDTTVLVAMETRLMAALLMPPMMRRMRRVLVAVSVNPRSGPPRNAFRARFPESASRFCPEAEGASRLRQVLHRLAAMNPTLPAVLMLTAGRTEEARGRPRSGGMCRSRRRRAMARLNSNAMAAMAVRRLVRRRLQGKQLLRPLL